MRRRLGISCGAVLTMAVILFSLVTLGGCSNGEAASSAQVTQAEGSAVENESLETTAEVTQAEASPEIIQTEVSQTEVVAVPEPEIPVVTNYDLYMDMYFPEDTIYEESYGEWAFDYSILIPSGFRLIDMNGDESHANKKFYDEETGLEMGVGAYNNYSGETLEGNYAGYLDNYDIEYSYIDEDAGYYVVSWVSGGAEWYYMEYVGNTIYYLGFVYPENDPRGDAIVEKVQPTFEPGDIWSFH